MPKVTDLFDERIKIIKNSGMRNRLVREINNLYDKKDNELIVMDVGINDDSNKSNYYPYSIKFYEPSKDRIYDIMLNCNYPFSPPKLNINYKPYSYYFQISSLNFKENL